MWRKRFFRWLGGFLFDHSLFVIILLMAFSIVAGYFASTIKINLGLLNLLDRDDPLVQRTLYANDNFGGMDYMTIGLIGENRDHLIEFSNRYVPLLRRETDIIRRVVEKVDFDAMLPYGLLFLDDQEREDFLRLSRDYQVQLANIFADGRLAPLVSNLAALLAEQVLKENEIKDETQSLRQLDSLSHFLETLEVYLAQGRRLAPFRFKRDLRRLFIQTSEENNAVISDEYFFSADGKMLVLRVMPSQPGDDYIFCHQMMDLLKTRAEKVGRDYPDVQVIFAGNVAVMADEHTAIVHDMALSATVSMIAVLALFMLVYRKTTDMVFEFLCLTFGVFLTFGLTYFVIGYLNILTAFFAAVVLGLGDDFAIQYISRYSEQRRGGDKPREATINALLAIGPGTTTGASTTAFAFLVLMTARFKAISELGFVAGIGILFMLFLMLTLLPAMIAQRDKWFKKPPKVKSIGESVPLGRLVDFMTRHRRSCALLVVIFTAAAVYGALQVKFNYDYRSLEPTTSVGIHDIKTMQEHWGRSIDYCMLLADTVDECRRLAIEANKLPTVESVDTISDFIPENQAAKNEAIRAVAPLYAAMTATRLPNAQDMITPAGLTAVHEALLKFRDSIMAIKQLAIVGGNFSVEDRSGEIVVQIEKFVAWLDEHRDQATAENADYLQGLAAAEINNMLSALQEATRGKTLTIDDLPQELVENFRGKDGKLVVYTYPGRDIWNEKFMKMHNAELQSVNPEAISIGILFDKIISEIQADFRSSVWYSLIMVLFFVYLDFRRLRTALLALVPLLTASLWMVGIMPLLGMSFNMANVATVPLILGIGIEYGVLIIHRFREEPVNPVRNSVENTGNALLLSALTTVTGFGSIGLATYLAIASLGHLLAIGVVFCFVTAIIVLPLILSYAHKKGWKI